MQKATVQSLPMGSGGGGYVFDSMPFKWHIEFDFADCPCCPGGGGGGNAPPTVTVPCCEVPIMTRLTAELGNVTNCPGMTGVISLVWNPSTSKWEGTAGKCGRTWIVKFYCLENGDGFRMDLDTGGDGPGECGIYSAIIPQETICDPIIVRFRFHPAHLGCSCCEGPMEGQEFEITVTE